MKATTAIMPRRRLLPTTLLKEMQEDINEATLQLESIAQMLQSHAIFLRSQNLDNLIDDVLLVEKQAGALALSILDLKDVTSKFSISG